jgi:hypothetical protein
MVHFILQRFAFSLFTGEDSSLREGKGQENSMNQRIYVRMFGYASMEAMHLLRQNTIADRGKW